MSPELETAPAETPPTENAINQEKKVFYDADAKQQIAFDEPFGDGEVVCHYEPLSDERYARFTRESKTKLVDGGDSISLENADALSALWDDQVFDIEGIEGKKPENWKIEIDDYKYKIPSMQSFLLVVAYAPKLVWGQTDKAIHTDAYFNGKPATQKHFLRKTTVEDKKAMRRFQRIPLNSKTKGLESADITISSYAVEKGELYDQMKAGDATGYAGRIPLWHKVAVIDFLMSAGLSQKK